MDPRLLLRWNSLSTIKNLKKQSLTIGFVTGEQQIEFEKNKKAKYILKNLLF